MRIGEHLFQESTVIEKLWLSLDGVPIDNYGVLSGDIDSFEITFPFERKDRVLSEELTHVFQGKAYKRIKDEPHCVEGKVDGDGNICVDAPHGMSWQLVGTSKVSARTLHTEIEIEVASNKNELEKDGYPYRIYFLDRGKGSNKVLRSDALMKQGIKLSNLEVIFFQTETLEAMSENSELGGNALLTGHDLPYRILSLEKAQAGYKTGNGRMTPLSIVHEISGDRQIVIDKETKTIKRSSDLRYSQIFVTNVDVCFKRWVSPVYEIVTVGGFPKKQLVPLSEIEINIKGRIEGRKMFQRFIGQLKGRDSSESVNRETVMIKGKRVISFTGISKELVSEIVPEKIV